MKVIGEMVEPPRWASKVSLVDESARAPRSGNDATTGFAALDQLRADHNGWNAENPPRLERFARIIKVVRG